MGTHASHIAEMHQRLHKAQYLHQEQQDIAGHRQPPPFDRHGIEHTPTQVHQRKERACQDDRPAGKSTFGIDLAGLGIITQPQHALVGMPPLLTVAHDYANQKRKHDQRQSS